MSDVSAEAHLPDEVHVTRFACARARELSALTQCLNKPANTRLVFQSLPRHMRRRVMSHDDRRLPRRLRPIVAKETNGNAGSEETTRRRRRRKRLTLLQFKRRQRIFAWLETHIWHAKRFRMVKRWGFSIAERPCDKAFRACYRASSANALLQDISYMRCLVIRGNVLLLENGFKRITDSKCSPGITAKRYLNGEREGETYVFHVDKYPFGCLGKISFVWISQDRVSLFVHPSFCSELVTVLVECFGLSKTESGDESRTVYKNENVEMIESRGSLNRFRLTGPLSHSVLQNVMKPISLESQNPLKKLLEDSGEMKNFHSAQEKYWQAIRNLYSPAELHSKFVLALNVEDPRINYPSKRMKAVPGTGYTPPTSCLVNLPAGLNRSLIWDEDRMETIVKNKLPNVKVNEIRQKTNLVPGEFNDELKNVSGVPVILIQQPGNGDSKYKKIGYSSGWDVLIPAGYGMPFWISLILRGARTGGLRESSKVLFESGKCEFQPDTCAYKEEDARISAALRDRYFRLPPNKRVNFIKLSINSPFKCRWDILLKDWNDSQDVEIKSFFVIRDRTHLEKLQSMISSGTYEPDFPWNRNCLVPVRLLQENKGKLTDFALICLPSQRDNPKLPSGQLVEPLKKDIKKRKRKTLRDKHKRLLKMLRRNTVRRKKKILRKSEKMIFIPKQDNTKIINSYRNKIQELWLPSNISNVRNQCSRETIGYVVKGDFSFTEAKGSGIGYVALLSLKKLLQGQSSSKELVLVRNTLSRQYRYAKIDIITNML